MIIIQVMAKTGHLLSNIMVDQVLMDKWIRSRKTAERILIWWQMEVFINFGLIWILEQVADRVSLLDPASIIRGALIVLDKGVILSLVNGDLTITVVRIAGSFRKVLPILIKSGFSSHLGCRVIYPGAPYKIFNMLDKTPEEEAMNPWTQLKWCKTTGNTKVNSENARSQKVNYRRVGRIIINLQIQW